jgi:hypothetical protein
MFMLAAVRPRSRRMAIAGRRLITTTGTTGSTSTTTAARPFEEIPGPTLLQTIQMNKDPSNPLQFWSLLHQRFGKLVRIQMPGLNVVLSSNPDAWPAVIKASGRTPGPLQILPWYASFRHIHQHFQIVIIRKSRRTIAMKNREPCFFFSDGPFPS